MNEVQKVDLYQPIASSKVGLPPLALRISVTPSADYYAGGVQQVQSKIETYVLLSALPTELQQRIHTAIAVLIAGR
jgi:hypothetical protein